MVCHEQLLSTGVVGLSVIVIPLSLLCCILFHVKTSSALKSACILRLARYNSGLKYVRKFVRSCAPVVYWIGEFPKIDREGCLSFVRFVTYRTFALVLKTKLRKDIGSRIVVYLPVGSDMF